VLDHGLDRYPESFKATYEKKSPPRTDQVDLAESVLKTCSLLNPMIEQIESTQIISFGERAKELKISPYGGNTEIGIL
jgi:hypothetical protein